MSEHPIAQEIERVVVWQTPDASVAESYQVGYDGVTKIEACIKSGMHSHIPYVRVWKSDVCVGEWCQHNILGLYFRSLG